MLSVGDARLGEMCKELNVGLSRAVGLEVEAAGIAAVAVFGSVCQSERARQRMRAATPLHTRRWMWLTATQNPANPAGPPAALGRLRPHRASSVAWATMALKTSSSEG